MNRHTPVFAHPVARRILFCALATSCAIVPAQATLDSEPAATALMHRVADAYAANTRGVIGVRSHSLLAIDATLYHRRITNDGWFVFDDGTLAKSSDKPDPRRPPLHDPYRPAYLAEYAFRFAACASCAEGTVTIAYDSASHDDAHAHGTLVVERASNRVLSDVETPYALPWPTQDGQLQATWGAAASGWFPLTIDGQFVGKIGPFVGHARYAQILSQYGRFGSVDDAVDAFSPATEPNSRSSPAPLGRAS